MSAPRPRAPRCRRSSPRAATRRLSVAASLLLATLAASACAEEKACTAQGLPPSTVRVVDRDGATVLDALVALRVPGGADRAFACTTAKPSEGCERRAVVLPSGTSTLVASRADGSSQVEMAVNILDDGTPDCPAQRAQQITIVLNP